MKSLKRKNAKWENICSAPPSPPHPETKRARIVFKNREKWKKGKKQILESKRKGEIRNRREKSLFCSGPNACRILSALGEGIVKIS